MRVCLLFLLVWVCCYAGCKKKDTGPTDINDQGEYFNCYIDGQYWTYKEDNDFGDDDDVTARQGQITLPGFVIKAENTTFPGSGFSLWMVSETFPSKDTVLLTTYSDLAYATFHTRYPSGRGGYEVSTNDTLNGQLIFTKRERTRLEGVFHFNGVRSDSGQVVRITDGRFSIIP